MGFLGLFIGRIRCPSCGVTKRHWRHLEREQEIREENENVRAVGLYKSLERLEEERLLPERGIGGYSRLGDKPDRAFVGKSCLYRFDLDESLEWMRIAKRVGNERTVQEYRKLQREHEEPEVEES